MEKRQQRLKHEQLAKKYEQFVKRDYLTTELEFSLEISYVNTSIDSERSFNITQPGLSNDKPQLTKEFVKDIA